MNVDALMNGIVLWLAAKLFWIFVAWAVYILIVGYLDARKDGKKRKAIKADLLAELGQREEAEERKEIRRRYWEGKRTSLPTVD